MRHHALLPQPVTGYALSPSRGMWSIVVPVAATNLISNPSVEVATTGYTGVGTSSITRTAARQRRGTYGLEVDPDTGGGVYYTITLSPASTYTWSLDERSVPGVPYQMRVYDVTAGGYLSSVLSFRGTGTWERRRLSFPTSANSNYLLQLVETDGTNLPDFHTDGWQCVKLPYDTTYLDGDQQGCSWIGVRHGSLSTRSAQTRRGGRVVGFDDYGFTVTAELGLGMEPTEDTTTGMGILGGALFQRTIRQVRTFSLVGAFAAASFMHLQTLQADLQDVLTPFAVAEQQPIALRYQAMQDGQPIGDELELLCHFTGGFEGSTDNLYQERCALQFSMYLPAIQTVGEHGAALGTTETITDANYLVERQESGVWHALGGGVGGGVFNFVLASAYGPDGSLYVAGAFSEAYNAAGGGSPVAAASIARWDGSSWAALGAGFNSTVHTLAFDAAGNLYAGGEFTNAGYPYLAVWDGSAWDPVGTAADATGIVYAIAFDLDGNVYVGGDFDDWDGIAQADNIAMWNGSAWSALGSFGADDTVYALVRSPNTGNIIAAGNFLSIDGVLVKRIAKWDGTAWDRLTPDYIGFDNAVSVLTFDATKTLYAGGVFTDAAYPYLARWNGTAWLPVGGGVTARVESFAINQPSNILVVGGEFGSAGDLTLNDRVAQWTGATWLPLGIDLPGSPIVYSLASHPDGRLLLGFNTDGTATASVADTDVTNEGTAPAAPIFTITGPGRIESIVNWTTRKGLYFSLLLLTGETVTVDLTPGAISIVSTFRGAIGGSVLGGSHLTEWRLLPGINTVVVKSTAAVLMRWRTTYQSIAGATR